MISIGNIRIDGKLALAPMAGTSSVTYRGICHEFGSEYAPTELCSARSIVYNGTEKSFRYLEINPETEGITAIQLFGSEPEDFATAIKIICEDPRLSMVSMIDINMGCPVSKVVKTGSGSGLIRTPKIAEEIIRTSVKAAGEYGKPVTVKTRVGYDKFEPASLDYAKRLCDAGASAICIHGRTATQMYSGVADINAITEIRNAVSGYKIPFIANGDIKDGPSAVNMINKTGADFLMIGRAAMGNPWVFEKINAYINSKDFTEPTAEEKCSMMVRELMGTIEHIDENVAVREFRSVMPHYIKGLPGAAAAKVKFCSANTVEDVKNTVEEFLSSWN